MNEIPPSKIKYDWYQSESDIVINILAKHVKPENFRVELLDGKLTCSAKLPDDTDFSLHWYLAHNIPGQNLKYKVFPSKIEIRLKKPKVFKWATLEASEEDLHAREATEAVRRYPSSKNPKNWDKIAFEIKNEEENEKLEGEEALSQLFQKIYTDGSDETRKAMNKSFLESGGTVLSTSWQDVAKGKVDVKPPDGVEYKKWDS